MDSAAGAFPPPLLGARVSSVQQPCTVAKSCPTALAGLPHPHPQVIMHQGKAYEDTARKQPERKIAGPLVMNF